MLAGAAIGYKTMFQQAIAHKCVAVVHVGKMALCFRSPLDDLNTPQHHATIVFEDNQGALHMENQQQPSPRT
jgi:hypothetical protein